jgi:cardiolipin synthase A/B
MDQPTASEPERDRRPSDSLQSEAGGGDRGDDLLDQAFARATGAGLSQGNGLRVLKDAAQNYPAWLDAIASAERSILFENYIVCDDEVGRCFASALAEKARAGVRVRVVYDWLGSLGRASRRFWRNLRAAGVEVRCFNPPHLVSPLSALHRDHRKLLAVDGRIGYVTGLCLGRMWVGDPERGIAPWRDTGVEVRGPALVDIERAFAQVWAATGPPLAPEDFTDPQTMVPAGDVALRIVASRPGLLAVLRLDELIAAAADRSLWLTDAYFAGIPVYVQALRSAAQDGVDVRLLVPGSSDIPALRPLSQAGYRPLLEAGVRVFEWKGSMLHAKTAVADGRWARVGSSNLNIASWISNYELDALVEDRSVAAQMEQLYLEDLAQSTEVVLERRRVRHLAAAVSRRLQRREIGPRHGAMRKRLQARRLRMGGRGSASRAAAGALRIGRAVGAALTEQRVLAPTETRLVAAVAVVVLALTLVIIRWPYVAAVPASIVLGWMAIGLFGKAIDLYRERRRRGLPSMRLKRKAGRTRGARVAPAASPEE